MPRGRRKNVASTTPETVESNKPVNNEEDKQFEGKAEEAALEEKKVVEEKEEAVEVVPEKEAAPSEPKKRGRKKGTTIKKEVEKKEEEKKETVKRGTVKKETEKKETVKKEIAKKDDTQDKKVCIQYAGKEFDLAAIEESVKKAWEAEGHRAKSMKKLEIYIKPEEHAAYYVINSKKDGRIDL